MSIINKYYLDIIKFVNSLVIKIDDIRIHQNYHAYVKHGYLPPNKSDSKYYQNITGTLNKNDYKVYWNGEELTREYLNDNLYLKNVLMYDTELRNKLCLDNPGMSDYIRGCMLDITMEEFLETENYKIIYYDKTILSENELGIINDLEAFIKMYMRTYHNPKFMVKELYLSGLLSNLYSAMKSYLIALKFENANTNKVDLFHLSNKLNSYKHTYNYSKVFDLPTNIWLYGNIDRLKHNVGKNEILDSILYKVFDDNIIGVAKISINNKLPVLQEDKIDDITSEFFTPDYIFKNDDANMSCYNISGNEYTADEIASLLMDNKLLTNVNVYDKYKEDLLLQSLNNKHLTNMMVLDTPEKVRIYYTNNFIYTISNFLYLNKNNDYLFTIDYYNNENSKLYKLSMNDVEHIIIYMLFELYGIDTNLELVCSGIYDSKLLNKNNILSKTWYKDTLSTIYDYIIDIPNLDQPVINLTTLQNNLIAKREIEKRGWLVISNIIDNTIRTDIEFILEKMFITQTYAYNKDTVTNYLTDNNLLSFVSNTNVKLLNDLLSKISNIYIDDTVNILEKYNKIKHFFNNVTSYTVNLLINNTFTDKYNINNVGGNVNIGYKPFIDIKSIDYDMYEELEVVLRDLPLNDDNIVTYNPEQNYTTIQMFSDDLSCSISLSTNIGLTESYTKSLTGKPFKLDMNALDISDESISKHTDNYITKPDYYSDNLNLVLETDEVSGVGTYGYSDKKTIGKPYTIKYIGSFYEDINSDEITTLINPTQTETVLFKDNDIMSNTSIDNHHTEVVIGRSVIKLYKPDTTNLVVNDGTVISSNSNIVTDSNTNTNTLDTNVLDEINNTYTESDTN